MLCAHGQLFTHISITRDLNLPSLQTSSEPVVKSARLHQPYKDTKDSQHIQKVLGLLSTFHAVAIPCPRALKLLNGIFKKCSCQCSNVCTRTGESVFVCVCDKVSNLTSISSFTCSCWSRSSPKASMIKPEKNKTRLCVCGCVWTLCLNDGCHWKLDRCTDALTSR